MTLFEKGISMQIIPFHAHYQSVHTNFDISSFSLISCTPNNGFLYAEKPLIARQVTANCRAINGIL